MGVRKPSSADITFIKSITQSIIPAEELEQKLKSGRRLRIKIGVDPTAPDLHLGHAIILSSLDFFQSLGHEIIFLIGDYTARIGDPSGRSKTRPPLSDDEIIFNSKTYFDQVGRIVEKSNLSIVYNSEWFSSFSAADLLRLSSKVTAARILEREDFDTRLTQHLPISMHELFYPLLQAYDSVQLRADIEVGGTDQTFNMLMGRFLQEQYGQEPQTIITFPLLPGLDGVAKMSKSLGNAVGLQDAPSDAYGKIMSLSDETMMLYFELLIKKNKEEMKELKDSLASGEVHPMEVKKSLAHHLISRYWSPKDADDAQQAFEHLFQKRDFDHAQPIAWESFENPIKLLDLVKKLANVNSSEARRLIQGGAVTVNDKKITNIAELITLEKNHHIRIGKQRFYKLI